MSAPRPRRAIENPVRRRAAARAAGPGAVIGGLLATGLVLATLPSPTSATSASTAAATSARETVSGRATSAGAVRSDLLDLTIAKREARTNRSTDRPALPAPELSAPIPEPTGSRYATVALNVRTKADDDAKVVTVLKAGAKIKVTDTTKGQWRQIVRDGKGQWVKKRYLVTKKPDLTPSDAPCKSGSGMESGLTADAIKVHRALCARFPQFTSFGGVRQGDGGEHGSGRAVDAMISDSDAGWEAARWVRAHAKQLGVSQVIYSQKIWTVQRSSEGWRGMSDRGSATANHYDHVHVTVYGNAAD